MNVTINNQQDIILDKNGEPQKPIIIDVFLVIIKLMSCFIGIPLNTFIAIIIVRLRRFHSKPRNIFLLGITLCNLFTFVPAFIEIIYWIHPLEIVCEAYIAVGGMPNVVLLWNTLLALVDRYVAIKYPIWHREKITVRRVIYFLLISSLFLIFLLKSVYIFSLTPIRCEIWFVHSAVMGWTMITLFVSCVIINFIVYRQTKTLLQKSRAINLSTNTQTPSSRNRRFDETEIDAREAGADLNAIVIEFPPVTSNVSSFMAIHVDGVELKRLELEATRTFIVGVTSLFATDFAVMILFGIFQLCRIINKFDCSSVTWLSPYFKELWLIHSVCNPIIWLIRNDELRLVLKSNIDAISRKYSSKKMYTPTL